MKEQTIDDVERATWYARLAFGIYQETEAIPQAKTKKIESDFYVVA